MNILDISNAVFQINNPISKDVDDYFTNNAIDISSSTDNAIEQLLETAFNLNGFKHLTNYLAYNKWHLTNDGRRKISFWKNKKVRIRK